MSYNGTGPLSTNVSNISIDEFGDIISSERKNQFQIKSTYGVSELRNSITLNSGTITIQNGEIELRTSGNYPEALVQITTNEIGRYLPGTISEASMGVRLCNETESGIDTRWGIFDTSDGFGFGYNMSSGLYVWTKKNGVSNIITSGNFNVATNFGNTFIPTDGHLFKIKYIWCGYGAISWIVQEQNGGASNPSVNTLLHTYSSSSGTSISNPNLPISIYISNNGQISNSGCIYLTCRSFATIGNAQKTSRIVSERRLFHSSVGTTFLPAISFRKKTNKTQNVTPVGIDIISDADLLVQLRVGADLTNPSWQTPTDYNSNETACESDVSATAISSGIVIYQSLIPASTKQHGNVGKFEIPTDIPVNSTLTLTYRTLTATATVTTVFKIEEDW